DSGSAAGSVAVVSGGVGAARFLRGLMDVVDHERITAVVNTGDDTVLHGLDISPDLDTVTYTLAGAIDPERGWGLVDESWRAMESLERYATVRPEGSAAAPRWFNLGDQDLATHFYRTARRREGASLTEITAEIARAWGLRLNIVPMTDDRCSTVVTLAAVDGEAPTDVSFQDYFVRLRHSVAVQAVRFDGDARLSDTARRAFTDARTIVIAPSNPIVSIGPMRSLPGVDELLASRRTDTVAVSPIVGGAALKGPADRMLVELGFEASVVGVARLYADIASVLVVDTVDEHLADEVERAGMRCVVAPSIMSTPSLAADLARITLAAGRTVSDIE
ncbi:MAG: 2-phospho-L-lactate transferase, partial [Ilumatobacter sp.]